MVRKGQWEYTVPFALGIFRGQAVKSVKFDTPFTAVVPVMSEFAHSGADPTGSRHLLSHPSFLGTLASGRGPASFSFDNVDMSITDISNGSGISETKVFIFRIADFECSTSRVHEMKLWISNDSDFLTKNTHRIVYETSQSWVQNKTLPVTFLNNASGVRHLPTSLPAQQNIFRQDGGRTIHQIGDTHVTEFIYIALAASGTIPLGQYGSTATSGFLLRMSYDVDNVGGKWKD